MVNNSVKVVGQIRLGSSVLDVYGDLMNHCSRQQI